MANLVQVPETGALIGTGFREFGGGTGGYARFVVICPPGWRYGARIGPVPDAPLRTYVSARHWDPAAGMRVR